MICNSDNEDGIPVSNDKTFRNWGGQVEFRAGKAYRPTNRADLVEIVKKAEERGERVKAVGSIWSFTGATVGNEVVIETDELKGVISRNALLAWLPLTETARSQVNAGMIQHVRAGTKICQLNRMLHGLPDGPCGGADEDPRFLEALPGSRALSTMGGSGGQSIAGVMSTGVHGGDVFRRPIADMVLAIHLVGPGGQEWWIERPGTLTMGTDAELEATIERLAEGNPQFEFEICPGVKYRKSEDLFRAAMVAVGRMGVIYSVVVAVTAPFKLAEFREALNWEAFSPQIAPRNFLNFIATERLHYLSVIINPFATSAGHACTVIKRRMAELSTPNNWNAPPPVDFQGILCSQQHVGDIVARFLIPLRLELEGAILLAFASPIGFILGPILAAGSIAAKAVLDTLIVTLLAASVMTLSEFIALVAGVMYEIGAKDLFADMMSTLLANALPPVPEARPLVAMGWKVMDTYNYNRPDNCQKVDAMEVAFDALDESQPYLDFITEALSIFQDLRDRDIPIATVFSLRFSHGTDALMGMSQFTKTCHVEIPLLQNFAGNEEFLIRAHAAALRHNGRPHWGQMIRSVRGSDISRIYGENHQLWQDSLLQLIEEGGGQRNTFGNNFTRYYNLEPGLPPEVGDCVLRLITRT